MVYQQLKSPAPEGDEKKKLEEKVKYYSAELEKLTSKLPTSPSLEADRAKINAQIESFVKLLRDARRDLAKLSADGNPTLSLRDTISDWAKNKDGSIDQARLFRFGQLMAVLSQSIVAEGKEPMNAWLGKDASGKPMYKDDKGVTWKGMPKQEDRIALATDYMRAYSLVLGQHITDSTARGNLAVAEQNKRWFLLSEKSYSDLRTAASLWQPSAKGIESTFARELEATYAQYRGIADPLKPKPPEEMGKPKEQRNPAGRAAALSEWTKKSFYYEPYIPKPKFDLNISDLEIQNKQVTTTTTRIDLVPVIVVPNEWEQFLKNPQNFATDGVELTKFIAMLSGQQKYGLPITYDVNYAKQMFALLNTSRIIAGGSFNWHPDTFNEYLKEFGSELAASTALMKEFQTRWERLDMQGALELVLGPKLQAPTDGSRLFALALFGSYMEKIVTTKTETVQSRDAKALFKSLNKSANIMTKVWSGNFSLHGSKTELDDTLSAAQEQIGAEWRLLIGYAIHVNTRISDYSGEIYTEQNVPDGADISYEAIRQRAKQSGISPKRFNETNLDFGLRVQHWLNADHFQLGFLSRDAFGRIGANADIGGAKLKHTTESGVDVWSTTFDPFSKEMAGYSFTGQIGSKAPVMWELGGQGAFGPTKPTYAIHAGVQPLDLPLGKGLGVIKAHLYGNKIFGQDGMNVGILTSIEHPYFRAELGATGDTSGALQSLTVGGAMPFFWGTTLAARFRLPIGPEGLNKNSLKKDTELNLSIGGDILQYFRAH